MKPTLFGMIGAALVITAFFVGDKLGSEHRVSGQGDHFQMHVDQYGRVYRLDRRTGLIHLNDFTSAGYLPEMWQPSPPPKVGTAEQSSQKP